jgi:hypothetical protein
MQSRIHTDADKSQTRLGSVLESFVNILIGYGVAVASTFLVFPIFSIAIPAQDNFAIGAYFTAISLLRSYCVRRFFNGR